MSLCRVEGFISFCGFRNGHIVADQPIRYIFMSSIPQNLIIFANLQLPTFFFKEQSPKIKFVNNFKKISLDPKLEKNDFDLVKRKQIFEFLLILVFKELWCMV